MRLLLDTHVFLWAVAGSPLLKPASRRLIESADEVRVSAASIREIAIKSRLGKIAADAHELAAAIEASGSMQLPVSAAHAAGVATLPLLHNDPFDRLPIAHAMAEPLRRVTADAAGEMPRMRGRVPAVAPAARHLRQQAEALVVANHLRRHGRRLLGVMSQ